MYTLVVELLVLCCADYYVVVCITLCGRNLASCY